MSRLLLGLRAASRSGMQAVIRNPNSKSTPARWLNSAENRGSKKFVERPRWLTLLFKTLLIEEGQYLPNSTIATRVLYIYGIPGCTITFILYWYKLHLEWPSIWNQRQDDFEEYLKKEQEEVEKLKL